MVRAACLHAPRQPTSCNTTNQRGFLDLRFSRISSAPLGVASPHQTRFVECPGSVELSPTTLVSARCSALVPNLFSLVTTLAHKDSAKVIGISFRDALSVWVGFRACFLETGVISACPAFFRSLRIPRGISVETSVLEIAGLELGLGLIMGDLAQADIPWRAWRET